MIKVMVADDERWIRKGIIKMLDWDMFERTGYGPFQIFEADTVDLALNIYEEERMEVVISDVKFPVEDGCTLCERIYLQNSAVKIIMISGYNEFAYVKRALQYKAVDYLLKPVDKRILNTVFLKCMEEIEQEKGAQKIPENPGTAAIVADSGDARGIILESMNKIRTNYQDKYSLADFAYKYNLSEAYYSAIFKKYSGVSLTTFIMHVKIDKAIDLMTTTRNKICDIGEMVGYEDQHYFTKVFKKVTKQSPRQYREMLKKELFDSGSERL